MDIHQARRILDLVRIGDAHRITWVTIRQALTATGDLRSTFNRYPQHQFREQPLTENQPPKAIDTPESTFQRRNLRSHALNRRPED